MLARMGVPALPFDACASAVMLDDAAHRIACLYKDSGERRLADVMADMMERAVDPAWIADADAVTWVPASQEALRRRGFDHAEELARAFASRLRGGPRARALLERPRVRDQRKLSRTERFQNMAHAFRAAKAIAPPRSVLIVDDVLTTGATLMAAASALKAVDVVTVRCITFARAF